MPARLVISSILAALLVASPAAAKLRVVATVPDLAAIALAVGGKRIQVDSLSTPHQDPHFVDARPHLMLKLNRADLLLVIGLQLEVGWLPVLLTGARNGKIQPGNEGYFDCSTEVQLRQVPQMRIDRSMGDIHPGGNPHYLLHPGNALQLARAVAARMGRLDPEGRKAYQANLKTFSEALQRAHRRWQTRMKPFHGTQVVAFHNAWVYFAEAMGLKIIDYLEPKPGIPPNPAHLLKLIRRMRAAKVPADRLQELLPRSCHSPGRQKDRCHVGAGPRRDTLREGPDLPATDGSRDQSDLGRRCRHEPRARRKDESDAASPSTKARTRSSC